MGRDSTLVLQKVKNKGPVFSFVLTIPKFSLLCNICLHIVDGSSINERIRMKYKASITPAY